MKQQYAKKLVALLLAFALVLTGSGLSAVINAAQADAASKKVTLKLSKTKLSLKAGKSTTLKITKKNVKKIKSQKWTTSKKSVATVSKKGKVTAKKAGTATIKCVVKYTVKGSKKTKSKTLKCTVKVTKATKATTPPVQPTVKPTATPPATMVKFNDQSNIGEEREVTIVGGTSDKMKIKDNGTVRKDVTSQYLVDNEMGLAINLGNTMEATKSMAEKMKDAKNGFAGVSATSYETAWSNAVTTQAYLDCLHSYGINTVRIPVAWSNMDSEDGTYTINEKYLGRVEEIVNYALNNGMYVIVNDHWDNQWWGAFGATKPEKETVPKLDNKGNPVLDADGNPVMELGWAADEETRAKAWKRYEAYWTQIADRFKGYSDHLILESANEELGDRLNDAICSNGYCVSTDKNDKARAGHMPKWERYETVNKINQKFVDIVRKSGGNNANRHLLIAGYNTNFWDTADARFKMPTDTEENAKTKLFVSVHYYSPWDFCGDGGTGQYTDENWAVMHDDFAVLKKFSDEGYGIIIGEDGVCNPRKVSVKGVTEEGFNRRTVPDRLRDAIEVGMPYHAVPVFWETGQYFDRANAQIKFRDVAQLFNELTGCNGAVVGGMTGVENNESSIKDVTGKTPVWSWTGKWYKNGGNSVVGDDRYEEGGGTQVVIGENDTEEQIRSQFVPESHVNATIEGDKTDISFDMTGYQAFLKLDLSKYKKPAIKFIFADGIPDPEENIGYAQLGPNSEAKFSESSDVDYAKFNGKAIELVDELALTEAKPYLSIAFSSKPTVTGIEIYELGE